MSHISTLGTWKFLARAEQHRAKPIPTKANMAEISHMHGRRVSDKGREATNLGKS